MKNASLLPPLGEWPRPVLLGAQPVRGVRTDGCYGLRTWALLALAAIAAVCNMTAWDWMASTVVPCCCAKKAKIA